MRPVAESRLKLAQPIADAKESTIDPSDIKRSLDSPSKSVGGSKFQYTDNDPDDDVKGISSRPIELVDDDKSVPLSPSSAAKASSK